MDQYQQFIAMSRYARYLPDKKRRESWEETVKRFVDYIEYKIPREVVEEYGDVLDNLEIYIRNLEVVPSMRLLMTAGEAVERDNIAAYNCSYLAVNNKRAFSETLYILMNGTGVGFSCERQEIAQLPAIAEEFKESADVIVVGDSKLGWAKAFKKYLSSLWDGDIPRVDFSRVRAAGSRLRTFGGRASGPRPLQELFEFCLDLFKQARGRKLTSIEVHDIMCKIGEVVVVGGVRRSALISLSNLTDRRMREAKSGQWWNGNPQRALANNSVAYTEKPDVETFLEEWLSLVKSKSGERGIFNRNAAQHQAAKWGRRDKSLSYGCNPCSEIILRDKQFCNLTEVLVREHDTLKSLRRKVEAATILGTIQSTLTNFNFLSEEWKKNTEEERLLGVSLTGIMDHPVLGNVNAGFSEVTETSKGLNCCNGLSLKDALEELRDHARKVNEEWAERLGIEPSAAITCCKPSGTVSQLGNTASGIHPRYSSYYIRSVRQDKKDPLTTFLIEQGVRYEEDENQASNMVFYFPVKSPDASTTRETVSALEQLELWLVYQRYWCEHKPSITVYVREHEWVAAGEWVYRHFDEVSGISFLPYSDHTYRQAPYTEVTKEEYEEALSKMPVLDWNLFVEDEDYTVSSQELACVSGACEI